MPHDATVRARELRFVIPDVRNSYIERTRITERLHGGIGNGLMVLQAPAGYGKSAALAAFAGEIDYEVRWISLDRSNTSDAVFAEHLGRALLGPEVSAPATVETAADLRAYVANGFRRFAEQHERPLLLVIDNAHELRTAYGACDLLSWVIDAMPVGYELVVSSREPLPIPRIDSRATTGECLVLTADDLAFSPAEAAVFCQARQSAVEPRVALEATGGWPIALAGVVSGMVPLKEARTAVASGSWERYLVAEVWEAVPTHLRRALLELSVAPVAEASLAIALIGRKDWEELRRWLDDRGLFSERLEGDSLRLNPSFQEFLRSELLATDPDRAVELASRTIERLDAGNLVSDAIQVGIDLAVPESLIPLLERRAASLLLQGSVSLLHRAFEIIPPADLEPTSPLNGLRLRVLAHAGFAESVLEQTSDLLRRPGLPSSTRFQLLLAEIRALRSLARGDQVTRLFRETRAAIDDADPAVLAEFYFEEAQNVLHGTSEYDRAERLLRQCYELAETAGALHLALLARSTRGQLLMLQGNMPAAVDELARAASGWRRMGGVANLGWVLNNLGMAYIGVADFGSSLTVLAEARQEAIAVENPRNEAFATASLADARIAMGDYEAAKPLYQEAIEAAGGAALDPTLMLYSLVGLSAAMLGTGDTRQADFLATQALELAREVANPHDSAVCEVQLAAAHSASGSHGSARDLAGRALQTFIELGAEASMRTARYRLAHCLFESGDRTAAEQALVALAADISSPWMVGGLVPLIREDRLFAQWAATRTMLPMAFRRALTEEVFKAASETPPEREPEGLPRVVARSLGRVEVSVDGRSVTEHEWATSRARELFFVFLASPNGLRKEEAVRALYPDLTPARCNSAFHSNLHRVRRALYQESIVHEDGTYRLNPDGEFEWDVARFKAALERAAATPSGSNQRAAAYREAIALYNGPFAEEFYGEWAQSIRDQVDQGNLLALASLAGFHAGRGQFETAVGFLKQVLAASPFNEEAAHELAVCHARSGNTVAALSFLDDFGRQVNQQLGHDISPKLAGLRSAIASGHAV